MNLKRLFGAILTTLGIIGLIYGAYVFMQGTQNWKSLIVISILGLIFFSSGIGLIKGTKDES
jgi:uncharacterized membrane protein